MLYGVLHEFNRHCVDTSQLSRSLTHKAIDWLWRDRLDEFSLIKVVIVGSSQEPGDILTAS